MRNILSIIAFFCLINTATVWADNRKIILLETMQVPAVTDHRQSIIHAFETQGFLSDGAVELEIIKAEGSKELAVKLLKESIALRRPDLVITVATLASQAAAETLAGSNIPILFCVVTDPVGAGLIKGTDVASGTNISGVVYTQQRDTKIEMVMRLLKYSAKESGVKMGIVATDYPSAVSEVRALHKIAALSNEIEFVVAVIPYEGVPHGLPAMRKNFLVALDSLKGKVDFLWQIPDPLNGIDSFSRILIDSGIPVIHGYTARSVKQGALMTVIYDIQSAGDRVVEMAGQIFNGADIGTLPVTVPKNFQFYLNMKTADRLGLVVPSHLLMIAGKNIIR